MLVPDIPPGLDVARYVTVPPFPVYAGAVKGTVAEALPAEAVPITGVSGFLPPESLVVMTYAAKSPITTHVFSALSMSVA